MISVIVPYWNSEEWLGRCARSLHEQDGDFEFLLVNDGSTDNGASIAHLYADFDERFIALDNENQKGVSGARNTGLNHARGEWVTFLDADDEFLGDAYRTFKRAIKRREVANVIQLNHLRRHTKLGQDIIKYVNNAGMYMAPNLPELWVGVWNKLYRTEFLNDIRFREGMQYGEDGLFVLECLAKDNRIFHADRDLMVVRHRFDNDHSLSHVKTAEDIINQIHEYEAFMERQGDRALKQVVCMDLSKLWARAARRIR